MLERINSTLARLCAVSLLALGSLALTAGAADASPEVIYNNFNTVPATVNGLPNQDTYSSSIFEFPFGGMVELKHTHDRIKSVSIQVDSFSCEVGEYQFENCYSPREKKKFKLALTASLYKIGAGNEPEATPFATATETLKFPYRPTTNVHCPATEEGKGFGGNCDVGGFLATVTFKHFNYEESLPEKMIVLITDASQSEWEEHPVNVGLQTSYKAFEAGMFVEEPPAEGGIPEVGSDPLPGDAYVRGKLEEGWANFQPVIEVTGRKP